MGKKKSKIVVAGDVTVDWFQVTVPGASTSDVNWQLYPGTRMFVQPGGALLLADMMQALFDGDVAIIRHHLANLKQVPPSEVVHSNAELSAYPCSTNTKETKQIVYRVSRFLGFNGPDIEEPPYLTITNDDPNASMVVIDDVGNGFRDTEKAWPRALTKPKNKPIVIYKTFRPLARGKLWDLVQKKHSDRLVVVINADDLRMEGMNISRRLSWERTAMDFAWQIINNEAFADLATCTYLIVRIGLDGAILYTRLNEKTNIHLFFDPIFMEGGFAETCPGSMSGHATAFVTALAAEIYHHELEGLHRGIRRGLKAARNILRIGFGTAPMSLKYPVKEVFTEVGEVDDFADVEVPIPREGNGARAKWDMLERWSILETFNALKLEDTAYEIVRIGNAPSLRKVPLGKFGALRKVDRSEIESFQSIRNLMREYLVTRSVARPLSVAVFGPPGSGKSFGVTQVAKTLGEGNIKKLAFNVAQFVSTEDLVSALHKVRDLWIKGKVPLVFFDEFDATFGNEKLGWLKYFLAPMQDGEFKDGEDMHPIGKAIFVFAGGMADAYQEFCGNHLDKKRREEFKAAFTKAKGTDFISRLRGYVDILGPNPQTGDDNIYMIRRALVLRYMLERKAKHLINETSNSANIDRGVLAAMIKVPQFKHGARSMEAILDMSSLTKRKTFEPAALPPKQQLDMHVEGDHFMNLILQNINWADQCEKLAIAIHELYRKNHRKRKPANDPAMQPWGQLLEDLKEANRQQAAHIPVKLRSIEYGIRPAKGTPNKLNLTDKQVERLAEMEHERWVSERLEQGWRYGKKRNHDKKISPYLVPWDELENEIKEYDRETVRDIPKLLSSAGFEAYKLT